MPEESELRFEAAISQLEEIVASLERGEPELAAALTKYETGVGLLSRCYALLERAERSVALLTGVDPEGNPVTAPFDAVATWEIEKDAGSRTSAKPSSKAEDTNVAAAPKPARARRVKPLTETDSEPPF